MSERLHLHSSIDMQRAVVDELEGKLEQVIRLGPGLPHAGELERLSRRLRPVFAREIHALRASISDLESAVATAPPRESWERVESVAAQVDRVAEELLLFIEGSLARAIGLEGGLCAIVDRLLDDLAKWTVPWERTAIPAAREATSNRTWIIGVRLTDTTIWSLPMMVHEFGHFAAERLEDRYGQRPGIELLSGSWLDSEFQDAEVRMARRLFAYPRAHELFADVFAAYALGPAYAAALMWRATPRRAWEASGDHPAWGFRVHAVLRAIGDGGRWYWIVEAIREQWQADLKEADCQVSLPAGTSTPINSFVDRAISILGATAPEARLVDEQEVLEAEERLVREAEPYEGLDVPTVVNAAWTWRVRNGWDEGRALVGEKALRWCHHVIGQPRLGTR